MELFEIHERIFFIINSYQANQLDLFKNFGNPNLVLIYNENDLNEDPKTGPSNIRASRSPACTILERLQNVLISKQNLIHFFRLKMGQISVSLQLSFLL